MLAFKKVRHHSNQTNNRIVMIPNLRYAVLFLIIFLFQSQLFAGTNPFLATANEVLACPLDNSEVSNFTLCGAYDTHSFQITDSDVQSVAWQKLDNGSCSSTVQDCPNTNVSCIWNTIETGTSFILNDEGEFRVILTYQNSTSEIFYAKSYLSTYSDVIAVTKNISINGLADGEITILPTGNSSFQHAISNDGGFTYGPFQSSSVFTDLGPGMYQIKTLDNSGVCEYVSSLVELTEPAPLVGNIEITKSISCIEGGEIMVDASGGIPPYSYALNGGAVVNSNIFYGLTPGNYGVQVFDVNGASVFTNNMALTAPNPISITLTTINEPCSGLNENLITVEATGGSGNFKYSLIDAGTGSLISFTSFSTENYTFESIATGAYIILVEDTGGCTTQQQAVLYESIPLEATATHVSPTQSNLNDGSISVITSGGSGSYQYAISPNLNEFYNTNVFTNLGVGTYTILIQDQDGCAQTIDVTLTTPDSLQLNLSKTDVSCAEFGTIAAQVEGGVPPYIYELDGVPFGDTNVFNGLTAGVYNVSVKDANNTFVNKSIEIVEPSPLVANYSAQSVLCFGSQDGQIEIQVSGGTGNYVYSLSNNGALIYGEQTSNLFENLAPGIYEVTVSDSAGCTYVSSIVIEQPEPLVLESFKTDPSANTTSDGSIALNASGGVGGYEYSIDGGVTFMATSFFENLAIGDYEITVHDAYGCIQNDFIQLGSSELTLTATVQNHISCGAQAQVLLTPTGGVPPYEYSSDGSSFSTTNPFVTGSSGVTTFTVRDANGTIATSNAVTINAVDDTIRFNAQATLDCDGINLPVVNVNITRGSGTLEYSIYDGLWQDSPTFLDVPDGDYVVKAKNESCEFALSLTVENVEPVKVRVLEQNEGKVTFQIQSGKGPFNYRINSYSSPRIEIGNNTIFDIDGLSPGAYWIVVDAANCSDHVTFDVEGFIPELEVETQVTNVSCFGENNGSISVAGVGGLGEYNYGLVDGDNNILYNVRPEITHFEGLAPGTYKALVRDTRQGLLVRSELITITEPEVLNLAIETINGSQSNSNTGNANISVEGGTMPYEFRLDTSMTFMPLQNGAISELDSGYHFVTVRDANGCQKDVIFTIETLPELNATVNVEYTGCEENEITLIVSEGSGDYVYAIDSELISSAQVSNKFLNVLSGNHFVTVFDANGYISIVWFEIEELISMDVNANITYNDDETSANISLEVTGGNAPYSYSINGDDFQETATFIDLTKEAYTIYVKDSLGCIEERFVELVFTDDSLSGKEDEGIAVYQNSGRTEVFDVLWQPSEESQTILVIYNSKGTMVHSSEYQIGMAQAQINVGNLSRGIYFIYIKNDEMEKVKKVLVQ